MCAHGATGETLIRLKREMRRDPKQSVFRIKAAERAAAVFSACNHPPDDSHINLILMIRSEEHMFRKSRVFTSSDLFKLRTGISFMFALGCRQMLFFRRGIRVRAHTHLLYV